MLIDRQWISTQQDKIANDQPLGVLKAFIIIWAIGLILIAITVNNKLFLAGTILYEVLP